MIDDGSCCIRPSLISIHIQVNTNYDLAAMESGSIIIAEFINPSHFSHLTASLWSPTVLGNWRRFPIDCAWSPSAAQRGQCVAARATALEPLPPAQGQLEAATCIRSCITSPPLWVHRPLWAARHPCPRCPPSGAAAVHVRSTKSHELLERIMKATHHVVCL